MPQDGADGNRISRWLLPSDHEFYADERTATLAEVRYYLQTLSMEGAPPLPTEQLRRHFQAILGHELRPGAFLDPIQKAPVLFQEFVRSARYVESGHIVPLSRGGRHNYGNATLMLKESNRLQSDRTVQELLVLLTNILQNQGFTVTRNH